MKKNKLLIVGWDSADWKIINRLIAEGRMPSLKSVIDRGVSGKIATMDPPLSPMLWTSMATGVRPFKHGVLGFVEHDGKGGIRPVSTRFRKVKAFWNMLTMEGLKSNIIGWWPSNPVESINGCMVSNLFQQEKKGSETMDVNDWPIPPSSVYPESMIDTIKDLRIHPYEISMNLLVPFVPDIMKLNQEQNKDIAHISKFLAHSATVHAVATELMEKTDWDVTAVYHDALDHFSHGYMRFYPPKRDFIDESDFLLYNKVVEGAYVYHDMMLDRLLSLIDENTTIMIVSDHGFHSDHLRPVHIPKVPSGPAIEHAPYGIFVVAGPGIKKGEKVYGASVLDVTPTILSIMDLPVGADMDGKPLMDIFVEERKPKIIDSWENDLRPGGEIVETEEVDNLSNEAALQQLIDLGYIDDINLTDKDQKAQIKAQIAENNLYLAKSFLSAGKNDEALEVLLEIEDKTQPDYRILSDIINCAIKTNRLALADEYITFVKSTEVVTELYLDLLQAKLAIARNNPIDCLQNLKKCLEKDPNSIEILLDLGKVYNGLLIKEEAVQCFSKIIEIDPENAFAYYGIGLAHLRAEEYETALNYFLDAIDRLYYYPVAHLHLAECLALLKEYEAAIDAFELSRTMLPKLPKIYRWLLDLYEITENNSKIEVYKRMVEEMQIGAKTVITGLPGQKLEDALHFLKDNKVNISDSLEIFETQTVDANERNWITKQSGEVVYIPLQFLMTLNALHTYKFIYIQEDLQEVVEYINAKSKIRPGTFNLELIVTLEDLVGKTNVWLSQQPNVDIHYIRNIQQVMEFTN